VEALSRPPEPGKALQAEEYTQGISDILENLGMVLDHLRKCMFSHDRNLLEQAEKEYATGLKASVPLAEKAIQKREKTALDKQFLECVPSLQKVGIAVEDLLNAVRIKVKTETAFTDRGLNQIGEIIGLIRSLARDTRDVLSTRNPDFRRYVEEAAKRIHERIEECDLEHEQRLIGGTCSSKASFLYLDIMTSLKRISRELSCLSEKA
jgi:Na+/phosphate symporter